jgi:hypothetical protein
VQTEASQLFRTRYVWWLIAVVWGFAFVLTAGPRLNPSVPLLGRAACADVAVVIAVVMLHARSAGVETSRAGVLVR